MALVNGKVDGLLSRGFADPKTFGQRTDLSPEVELGSVIDLVACHAGVLIDNESEVGGERGKKVAEARVDVGVELAGDELVRHGTDQHHGGCKGGVG